MQTFESFKCKTNGVDEMVLYSLQNPEKYWIIQVDVPN